MNSRPVAFATDLPRRGLADARRPDEAEDRPLQLVRARLHRQELDDPVLDLLQPVVVVVEHLLGEAEILLDLRLLAPGDRQHPLEVVAHHRRLGRHRAHRAELLQLADRLLPRLLGELGLVDALLELGGVVLAFALAAQLALDRLHLLVQVVLALGPLHLGLDAALDLLLDLQHGHLALHQAVDRLQPLADVGLLEKLLLLLELGAEMPGDGVGELGRRHASR